MNPLNNGCIPPVLVRENPVLPSIFCVGLHVCVRMFACMCSNVPVCVLVCVFVCVFVSPKKGKRNQELAYEMGGKVLKVSEKERDLGVIMHRSAKPSRQCAEASKRQWRRDGAVGQLSPGAGLRGAQDR